MLAPFAVRSYRIQWPADLFTSAAFEMELIILGWYVLVETNSVFWLTLFASVQYLGTWIAPFLGMLGDRMGHRRVLGAMRATYAVIALALMTLALAGGLTPTYAILLAACNGLVRPADNGVRAALVAAVMPAERLMGAIGLQRTTQDIARIGGALAGAGLVALLGIGAAYAVVSTLYVAAFALTTVAGRGAARPATTASRSSPWRELREGLGYVRHTPRLHALMWLAFLMNLTAFPMMMGLLAYVTREIYRADQTWLGYLSAAVAAGAFLSSLALSRFAPRIRAGRVVIVASVAWLSIIIVFTQVTDPVVGLFVLFAGGIAQGASQTPMQAALLRTSEPRFRGRVMGVRMLAIYSNLPGLLLAGPLVACFGYPITASLYCVFGLACVGLILGRWGAHLWPRPAAVNAR